MRAGCRHRQPAASRQPDRHGTLRGQGGNLDPGSGQPMQPERQLQGLGSADVVKPLSAHARNSNQCDAVRTRGASGCPGQRLRVPDQWRPTPRSRDWWAQAVAVCLVSERGKGWRSMLDLPAKASESRAVDDRFRGAQPCWLGSAVDRQLTAAVSSATDGSTFERDISRRSTTRDARACGRGRGCPCAGCRCGAACGPGLRNA